MTTIGLLGGTFDPPHAGHKGIAQLVLDRKLVDAVWFLPCWKHAFGQNPSSFVDRLAMCHLMVRKVPFVEVCADECLVKATYSVDTLKYLRGKYPDLSFRLILGADNYSKMDKWKSPTKVLGLAPPVWIERPGEKKLPESVNALRSALDFSSAEVRRHVAGNNFGMAKLETNPSVVEYINRERLYR